VVLPAHVWANELLPIITKAIKKLKAIFVIL
jgi:hypothetical protein